MGHRRTLRKDTLYDEIVALLRPISVEEESIDLVAIEELRRQAIENMRKRSAAQAGLNRSGARPPSQWDTILEATVQRCPPPPPSAFVVHLKLELRNDIEGSSDDHPVPPLERPYLKMLASAKVSTLKQFIRLQHHLTEDCGVFLSIEFENQVRVHDKAYRK